MKKITCCNSDRKQNKNFVQVSKFLNIISETNRLQILCVLRSGEKCVCDIYEALGISQNLVSHHLKKLKEAEIVDSRRDGRKIIYCTNKKVISEYIDILNNFLTKNV